MKRFPILLLILFAVNSFSQQFDTIRVMYYNMLNFPGTTPERIDFFKKTFAYAMPDVLVINELISEDGADYILDNGININGIDYYERADFTDGYDTDNMLFYNSQLFSLKSQNEISTALRLINGYQLYYNNANNFQDTVFLNFFSAHLKASSGSTNEQLRLEEVQNFTAYINGLPSPKNIFFGGDMNFYNSGEPAYQHLINNASVNMLDPLGSEALGDWHNNASFTDIHTQSTRSRQFGGGAYGGLDDRFDFIFCSADIINGNNNVTFIENSYIPLGNDGNHFNDSINAPPNNAVPDSIANALHYMSDHLPVIADFAIFIPEISESISLLTPAEGEEINSNTFYPIMWSSVLVENVNLYYKQYSESTWTEIESNVTAETGQYEWNVPYFEYDSCFILIESAENSTTADTSEMFYIYHQSVEIINPTDGEEIEIGNPYQITWNSLGIENINIYYKQFAQNSWTEVATLVEAETGQYDWALPYFIYDSCFILLESSANANLADTSNMFYIFDPTASINELSNDNQINFFPNPSNGKITVQLSNREETYLQITNLLGQVMVEKKIHDKDVLILEKGTYIFNAGLSIFPIKEIFPDPVNIFETIGGFKA